MSDQKYTHESYGQISISRVTCNGVNLFGSSIKHNSFISIKINQSTMLKDNKHSTYYFPKDKIIEVKMTSAQFAELITTLNYGAGTPCTIEEIRDVGRIEYKKPFEEDANQRLKNTIDIEKEEFKKVIIKIQDHLKNILSKKHINKSDREELKTKIDILIRESINNYKFAESQFKKQMEDHIVECKAEIESTLTQITHNLNYDNIQKQIEETKE